MQQPGNDQAIKEPVMLKNKKVAVFGERDDVAGLAVRHCVEAAGAEVVYETTSCFV
jgi:glycine reductase